MISILLAVCSNQLCSAETDQDLLKAALIEYRSGDYSHAAGHFYAALPTEFSNPSVHYYMASCYVHLKDLESAVREFRIAYALSPNSEVGAYASSALKNCAPLTDHSIDANAKPTTNQPTSASPSANDSHRQGKNLVAPLKNLHTSDQSIALIHSQAEHEKSSCREQSEKFAEEIRRQRDDRITKAVIATGVILSTDLRERDRQLAALPDDQKMTLNSLKSEYDCRRDNQIAAGRSQAQKIAEVAENLQSLIEIHSIQAAGSNLYVRNYK